MLLLFGAGVGFSAGVLGFRQTFGTCSRLSAVAVVLSFSAFSLAAFSLAALALASFSAAVQEGNPKLSDECKSILVPP